MTPVVRSLPCGHSAKTQCHVDTLTLICTLQCGKDLPCGHSCVQPCGHTDTCGTSCKEVVKKIILKCRHKPSHWAEVTCDTNIETQLCNQLCSSKLPCGHLCLGTCNDCESLLGDGSPGVHKACSEPCWKALDCNHSCKDRHRCGDGSRCPPCLEPCAVKCSHRECQLMCGEPCSPCEEQCTYSCPHMTCEEECGRPHYCVFIGGAEKTDIALGEGLDPVCNERCSEMLRCGHRCQGYCGEECPALVCATCHPTSGYSADDRFIVLGCGHTFEAEYLHVAVKGVGAPRSQRKVPACPNCNTTISGVHRYSSLVRERLRSMEPEVLLRQEEQLCREFAADERPINPKIEELTAMLSSRPGLEPVLNILLGKLYAQSGSKEHLHLAKSCLTKATKAPTNWVRVEAYTCLGYLTVCKGHPDDEFPTRVEDSTERKLESALSYFASADITEETKSRDIFDRTSPHLAEIMDKIEEKLAKLKAEKEAKLPASEAAKRQHDTRSTAALPDEQSTPLLPSTATPRPLFVAVPTTGGSPLHIAAAEGNIRKVTSRSFG